MSCKFTPYWNCLKLGQVIRGRSVVKRADKPRAHLDQCNRWRWQCLYNYYVLFQAKKKLAKFRQISINWLTREEAGHYCQALFEIITFIYDWGVCLGGRVNLVGYIIALKKNNNFNLVTNEEQKLLNSNWRALLTLTLGPSSLLWHYSQLL